MADIDVQRKKPAIWPWIIGLLLLAGLVWLLVELMGDDENVVLDQTPVVAPVATDPAAVPAATTDPAVEQYVGQCTSISDPAAQMSLSHEFTATCVRLLADGLGSVVEREAVAGTALQPALDDFRQKAAALEQTPETSPDHSGMLRDVAVSSADLMAGVQQARTTSAPGLESEVSQARAAAESIGQDTPLLDQSEAVGGFFQQAGEALRLLAQP